MARSARLPGCRPFVGPGAGVYRIEDGYLGLLDRPPGEGQRIEGVLPGVLSVPFRALDVEFMTFVVDTVLQVPRSRRGVGLDGLPRALCQAGGLPGLVAGSWWAAISALTC